MVETRFNGVYIALMFGLVVSITSALGFSYGVYTSLCALFGFYLINYDELQKERKR